MIPVKHVANWHTSLFWSLDSQAVSLVWARWSNIRDGRNFHICISSCDFSKWIRISHSRLYRTCSLTSYIYSLMHKTKVKLRLGTPSEEQGLKVFWEQGAEVDIWAWEEGSNRRQEKITHWGASWSVFSKYYLVLSNQEKLDGKGLCHLWGEDKCIQCYDAEASRKKTTWKTYI